MASASPSIGVIDLGGTKVYSAIVDGDARLLGEDLRPTDAAAGQAAVVRRLIDSLTQAAGAAKLDLRSLCGVAVAAPGPVDAQTGHVIDPPNLPGWGDVPLGPMLSEQLNLPVAIENDANAAALGEYLSGAGQGARALIYVTVSTGIGGGIVLGGELYRGADGAAGEIGHMVLRPDGPLCGCGNRGCLEALASGTAIAREGHAAVQIGLAPGLARLASAEGGEITGALVAKAAQHGDQQAQEIVKRAGTMLGVGLGNLVNLFNPDVIVVGGGAAQIGAPLLDPAERMMRQTAFPIPGERVRLRPAALDYAAIPGLAGLARALSR